MARLDVFPMPGRGAAGYVVDIQADLLSHFSTRVVVPLLPLSDFGKIAAGLNPVLRVEGKDHVLLPQAIATVPRQELRVRVASLNAHHDEIVRAIDVLLSGV